MARTSVVLCSDDTDLRTGLLAAAAAADVAVREVSSDQLRSTWAREEQIFVGIDRAAAVAAQQLPRRDGVHLLVDGGAEFSALGCALDARVIRLPEGRAVLVDRLGRPSQVGEAGAPVLSVVGAGGGAGASTAAVGLALALARDREVLLTELDVGGGGLDLALGIEHDPGWRWDAVAGASGAIAGLGDRLPTLENCRVLAAARSDAAPEISAAGARAVVTAGHREGAVVIDLPRADLERHRELVAATRCQLVVSAELRQLAAARALLGRLSALGGPVDVVLRRRRGSQIGPITAEEALGAPVTLTLPDDRRLASGVAAGVPVRVAASRRWRRAVRQWADQLQEAR